MNNFTVALRPETEQTLRQKAADRGRSLEGYLTELAERDASESAGPEIIELTRIEHGGAKYHLQKPIVVRVECADGNWIYQNDTLNLWGHGESREDALRDLQDNFAYLWQEIAEEQDEVLDSKALAIKRQLRELVPASAK